MADQVQPVAKLINAPRIRGRLRLVEDDIVALRGFPTASRAAQLAGQSAVLNCNGLPLACGACRHTCTFFQLAGNGGRQTCWLSQQACKVFRLGGRMFRQTGNVGGQT